MSSQNNPKNGSHSTRPDEQSWSRNMSNNGVFYYAKTDYHTKNKQKIPNINIIETIYIGGWTLRQQAKQKIDV